MRETCRTFLITSALQLLSILARRPFLVFGFVLIVVFFFSLVTGFDLWGAVLAMGLVCTLYTALVRPETAPLFITAVCRSKTRHI